MDTKKCPKCGGTEFEEGSDYIPVRKRKMAIKSSYKIYTFCLNCGEVYSIRLENTSVFKKK